jgi:hypothetical protein
MAAKPGDTIRAPSEKLGQPERRGKIVEILGDEKHPRFKVRWDDAHEPCSFPVPMSASRAVPDRSRRKFPAGIVDGECLVVARN